MTAMPPILQDTVAFTATDPLLAGLAVLASLATVIAVVLAARSGWRVLRKYRPDDLLTFADATLTSAVVATGMWHFAGERLHFTGLERVLLFAILEITVLTCAVRARRNISETGTAGSEGVAIWVVSVMSGVFAATATTSAPEALFRLALPLLATWLWERSLLPARRASGKQGRWHAFTERALARLGLVALQQHADEDAAARWRIAQLARAVVRAKRAGKMSGRWRRWRVDMLTVAANERAELATRTDRRDLLLAYIGTLLGTGTLVALEPPAPWDSATVRAAWERAQQAVPEDALETPPIRPEGALGDGSEDGSGDGLEAPQSRPEDGSGDGLEDGPKAPSDRPEGDCGDGRQTPPPARPRRAAIRLRAGHGKTAEQLVPHVLAMIDAHGQVGRDRVKVDLRVGSDTAKAALDLALKKRGEATVTPINRAMG